MTIGAFLQIIAVAVGSAVAVGALGLAASWLLRRRAILWHLALLALVAVVSPYVGLIVITQQMFLSGHDLTVATYVATAAALVTVVVALGMGVAIGHWAREVRGNVHRLGQGEAIVDSAQAPAEFRQLTAALTEAQQELAESRAREQVLEQSRRDLVSWVSHDLRTPLAGVRAMTEALEDGMAPDPSRYLTQMRQDVDRMSSMVDDLFELSRIQAGALVTRAEPVDLRDLISEALASADPVARACGVNLGGAVDGAVRINADAAALSRAVSNLLMNAIRHTPADGSVHVQSEVSRGEVVVSVDDQCGGIPEAELDSVLDLGWRGESARTPGPHEHGSRAGLGLAIVRGIVEAHHGEVSVENLDPGSGCRFQIRLPVLAVQP